MTTKSKENDMTEPKKSQMTAQEKLDAEVAKQNEGYDLDATPQVEPESGEKLYDGGEIPR